MVKVWKCWSALAWSRSHTLHALTMLPRCHTIAVWEALLLLQFENPQLLPQEQRSFSLRITIWLF